MANNTPSKSTILDEALQSCRKIFYVVFGFSFATNLLMLMLPIYTLQVLDRVISSGSLETLTMLTIVCIVAFIALGLLYAARSFVLIRLGEWLDRKLAAKFLGISIASAVNRNVPSGSQNLRDLNSIKSFLTGAGINALFDAPWSLIFILVIYLIHPINGMIALVGSLLLFSLALLNEYATKPVLNQANEDAVKMMYGVDVATRNAEAIEAMGMLDHVVKSWEKDNESIKKLQSLASGRAGLITNASKAIRLILQVFIIGTGAYLVLNNELSVGSIIACSILAGRALAPFEAAIASWKGVTEARKSYHRLQESLQKAPERDTAMSLPDPKGELKVEKVVFAPPGVKKAILKNVTFGIHAGDILGIVGPSGAGKSTLAKLLVGVWKPISGVVRLDNAEVYSWNRTEFGRHVGYLPQDVELFSGTVKENIARMDPSADPEEIVKAAQLSGAHEMILHLPDGYDTRIGIGGIILSGGQRQRIGLARAFYGSPKLVVLDEPNANLDQEGEAALTIALRNAKANKITTIIISHRTSVLVSVDKILVMQDGTATAMGGRDEILEKFATNAPQRAQQQSKLPPKAAGDKPTK